MNQKIFVSMQMQRVIRLSYQAEPSQAYAMELNLAFSFKTLFQFITRFLFNGFFNFFQQKKKLFLSFSQKHSNFKVCPFQIFRFLFSAKSFMIFLFLIFVIVKIDAISNKVDVQSWLSCPLWVGFVIVQKSKRV